MVFVSRECPVCDLFLESVIYRFLRWNDVLGQKLDKLRTLGSPKIVQLMSSYNDTQILVLYPNVGLPYFDLFLTKSNF